MGSHSIDDLEAIAVLGAGTMGHGIAQVCAQAGFDVRLYDVDAAALERGRARIRASLDKGVARGKLEAQAADEAAARVTTSDALDAALAGAGLVIEAAPERLELKRELFARLGRETAPGVALASNTSSVSIGSLGEASGRSEDVIGLHFFNPVPIMALLEIVVGPQTSAPVVTLARALAERLGKRAIEVRDTPGFATSRLGIALAMEAIRMLEQGVASARDIDTAMELGYRHPMGPLRLTDLVGLDVRLDIARYLHESLGSAVFEPPQLLEQMVAEGRLGKKVGRGFYDYDA